MRASHGQRRDSVRIVAGVWAGRELVSPGKRVRATAENVRDHWMRYLDEHLQGARVLDLFCGSGALGLEALSRGAAQVDFVEDAAVALHALKANVAARKLRAPEPGSPPTARRKAARIFKRDAIPFVNGLEKGSYDLAFADPPYGSRKLDLVIERWQEVRFARILAVEHSTEHPVPAGGKKLDFGEVTVTVYGIPGRGARRRASAAGGSAPGRASEGSAKGGEPPTGRSGKSPSPREGRSPRRGG